MVSEPDRGGGNAETRESAVPPVSPVPWGRVIIITLAYMVVAVGLALAPDRSWARAGDTRDAVARGAQVWREQNCMVCHSLFGLGGQLGPDLTNVLTTKDEGTVLTCLVSGRPGMPPYELSLEQMNDLLAYLHHVDASGEYPLTTRPLNVFGRIP